jgi:GxxExxY protein
MENQIGEHREYLNHLSSAVIGAAVTVHKEMGPGLLEAVYQLCMVKELQSRNVAIAQSVPIPLFYKSEPLNKDYIIDLLVENEIIIELKAVEGLLPVHEAQILSYLKLANKKLGFLINFNVPLMKLGFKRYVNGF